MFQIYLPVTTGAADAGDGPFVGERFKMFLRGRSVDLEFLSKTYGADFGIVLDKCENLMLACREFDWTTYYTTCFRD